MIKISWNKLVQRLLPWLDNRPFWVSWLAALCAPVVYLYGLLQAQYTFIFNIITYNGQVIVLSKLLNDTFDNIERRIYITNDGLFYKTVPIFTDTEGQPYPSLYSDAEMVPATDNTGASVNELILYTTPDLALQYDFTVWIPAATLSGAQLVQLNAIVNYYKIAGKRYTLKTF